MKITTGPIQLANFFIFGAGDQQYYDLFYKVIRWPRSPFLLLLLAYDACFKPSHKQPPLPIHPSSLRLPPFAFFTTPQVSEFARMPPCLLIHLCLR